MGGLSYPNPNPTWLTAAIEKIAMTSNSAADDPISMKFGLPMGNEAPMVVKRPKSKPEVEFQYGGRLFLETESINISIVD